MNASADKAIPESQLAEHWFAAQHESFERLAALFRASGLKQKDLADRLGKDESQVSRWLKGRRRLTSRAMSDLARAMDHRFEVHFTDLKAVQPTNRYFDARQAEAESNWQNSEATPPLRNKPDRDAGASASPVTIRRVNA
jgi:transcriptional regulator with XRE-family HTH domain